MKAGGEVLGLRARDERGRRVGRIVDLLFDDACVRVTGLVVRKGWAIRTRRVVPIEGVGNIGATEVRVAAAARRRLDHDESTAVRASGRSVQGTRLETGRGEYLGIVTDVVFDEHEGRVLGFEVVDRKSRSGDVSRTVVPATVGVQIADAGIMSKGRGA